MKSEYNTNTFTLQAARGYPDPFPQAQNSPFDQHFVKLFPKKHNIYYRKNQKYCKKRGVLP
jgi:hypothetical protein